jgi:hypothetical protein
VTIEQDDGVMLRFDTAAELREFDLECREWGAEPTVETLIDTITVCLDVESPAYLPRADVSNVLRVAVMKEALAVSSAVVTSGQQGRYRESDRISAAVLDAYMASDVLTPYLEQIWSDVHTATGLPLLASHSCRLGTSRANQSLAASIAVGLEAIAGPPDPDVVKQRLDKAEAEITGVTESIGLAGLSEFPAGDRQRVLEHLHVWLVSESAQVHFDHAAGNAESLTVKVSASEMLSLLRDKRLHRVLAKEFVDTVALLDIETTAQGLRVVRADSPTDIARELKIRVGWSSFTATTLVAGTLGRAIVYNMAAFGTCIDGAQATKWLTLDEVIRNTILPRYQPSTAIRDPQQHRICGASAEMAEPDIGKSDRPGEQPPARATFRVQPNGSIECDNLEDALAAREAVLMRDTEVGRDAPLVRFSKPLEPQEPLAADGSFEGLLHRLCGGVTSPVQHRGRPRKPVADVIFTAVQRSRSGLSSRRAMAYPRTRSRRTTRSCARCSRTT